MPAYRGYRASPTILHVQSTTKGFPPA
jgi:hypothetical protein